METPPPRTGSLIDWLRNEAKAPFETPRGDVGDQVALQWLPEFAENDSRVPFAVEHLLGEGDELVVYRLIHVASTSAAMRRAIAAALPHSAASLAQLHAGGGFTELGRAVRVLGNVAGLTLSPAAAQALHDIDRTENGWPTSAAIGLALAPDEFVDLLPSAVMAATDEQIREFALVLIGASEAALDKVFRAAATQPDAVRQKLADAVKGELETKDQSWQKLAAMGFSLPPTESGASRWQRYAPLLGVTP